MKPLVFLISGEEPFLRRKALAGLLEKHGNLRRVTLVASEIKPERLVSEISSFDLFSRGGKLLVVHEAERLKVDIEAFDRVDGSGDTVVILLFDKKPDWRKKPFNSMRKKFNVVDCDRIPAYKREFVDAVRDIARSRSLTISAETVDLLVSVVGTELFSVDSAFRKMAYVKEPGSEVTKADVSSMCSDGVEHALFDINDAVGERNAEKSASMLQALVRDNGPGVCVALAASLFRFLERLATVRYLKSRKVPKDKIVEAVGLPPFVVGKISGMASRWTMNELVHLMVELSRVERQIRSGRGSGDFLLEATLWTALGRSRA